MKSAPRKSALEKAREVIAPRLIRAKGANIVLGGRQVRFDLEAAGWLKALARKRRLTLYGFADVHGCVDRIERGEYPPSITTPNTNR